MSDGCTSPDGHAYQESNKLGDLIDDDHQRIHVVAWCIRCGDTYEVNTFIRDLT